MCLRTFIPLTIATCDKANHDYIWELIWEQTLNSPNNFLYMSAPCSTNNHQQQSYWLQEIVCNLINRTKSLAAMWPFLSSLCVCFSMCRSSVSMAFLCALQCITYRGPVSCKLPTPRQTTSYSLRWVLSSSTPLTSLTTSSAMLQCFYEWVPVLFVPCSFDNVLWGMKII